MNTSGSWKGFLYASNVIIPRGQRLAHTPSVAWMGRPADQWARPEGSVLPGPDSCMEEVLVLAEVGDLVPVEASPEGYKELGSAHVIAGEGFTASGVSPGGRCSAKPPRAMCEPSQVPYSPRARLHQDQISHLSQQEPLSANSDRQFETGLRSPTCRPGLPIHARREVGEAACPIGSITIFGPYRNHSKKHSVPMARQAFLLPKKRVSLSAP